MIQAKVPITDGWQGKIYEAELTKKLEEVYDIMQIVDSEPTEQNLSKALSAVKTISKKLLLSNKKLNERRKIVDPVINKIELILRGSMYSEETKRACEELGIKKGMESYGKTYIINQINIVNQLWEILNILLQWGYEEGFFVVKPIQKKFGSDALEDTLLQ